MPAHKLSTPQRNFPCYRAYYLAHSTRKQNFDQYSAPHHRLSTPHYSAPIAVIRPPCRSRLKHGADQIAAPYHKIPAPAYNHPTRQAHYRVYSRPRQIYHLPQEPYQTCSKPASICAAHKKPALYQNARAHSGYPVSAPPKTPFAHPHSDAYRRAPNPCRSTRVPAMDYSSWPAHRLLVRPATDPVHAKRCPSRSMM